MSEQRIKSIYKYGNYYLNSFNFMYPIDIGHIYHIIFYSRV